MKRRILASFCACLGVFSLTAEAQSPRFYATPFRVHGGDAVTFIYLDTTNSIPRSSIASWQWDFDGDGTIDAQGTDPAQINAVWYATFDPNRATNGVFRVRPRLYVTDQNGASYQAIDGVTEDVFGLSQGTPFPDGRPAEIDRDPFVEVKEFAGGNTDVIANFGTSQRLTTPDVPVRLFADVTFRTGTGRLVSVDWNLKGEPNFTPNGIDPIYTGASAISHTFTAEGSFNVAMRVRYQMRVGENLYSEVREYIRTKQDFIRVLTVNEKLSLGRAYRRGFPEEYDWDDLVQTYSAPTASGDRYHYYHHFEEGYSQLLNSMGIRGQRSPTPDQRQLLAEYVNELLQGQLLVGNQRLVTALRIKYPRLIDPEDTEERLSAPPGVREETAAIDVALLDYQAALFHVFQIVQEFGLDILRSKAPEGKEPFPEFPRYITFIDPSLAQVPIPIKNEYSQLTWCLDRMALGTVEKSKKLFRLSVQDETARQEAKEECKKTALQCYLGMAMLAAGQSTNDFRLNEGNSLLAHVKNARDLFEGINAGLNPLGNDGSFIPNESFSATYQDAQESVQDAKSAEIEARNEKREFDQRQSTLRSELLSQRGSYITPLKLLTGIDPVQYNNLQTVTDQNDYRNTVRNRIQAILRDYPNTSASGAGELGEAVLGVLDAAQNAQQRVNDVENLFKRIDLQKWKDLRINNVADRTTQQMYALDVLIGAAEGGLAYKGEKGQFSWPNVAIGAAMGALRGSKDLIRAAQNAALSDITLEAEIKGQLIEEGNLVISIERAGIQLDQTRLRLENIEQRMDRLIEDLAHTRATAENLYFTDPSFRVVVSRAQRRAEAELDFAVDRLYRLAKTLEYEWTEPYQNPLVIPVDSYESASLENPLFDKFTQLDSVFNIRSADESKDYLDSLKAWDSKLRRINVTSVRGPNHAGPISAEPISLREQVFNFKPVTLHNEDGQVTFAMTLAESVQRFRDFLETKRVPNAQNPSNPSLELRYATTIEDNRFFPATGAEWNMRIHSIRVDLVADSGFNTKQVAEVELTQSGTATIRRFFAEPPAADDLLYLTFNAGRNLDRSAFSIKVPARINGATGGRPPTEFEVMTLQGRPVAATEWILRIKTDNPSNRDINFSKLKDIIVRFTYTYGNPAEFPGF